MNVNGRIERLEHAAGLTGAADREWAAKVRGMMAAVFADNGLRWLALDLADVLPELHEGEAEAAYWRRVTGDPAVSRIMAALDQRLAAMRDGKGEVMP